MPVEGPQDAVLGPAGCTQHAVRAVPVVEAVPVVNGVLVVEAVPRELSALLLALPLRALGLYFLPLLGSVHSCSRQGEIGVVGGWVQR